MEQYYFQKMKENLFALIEKDILRNADCYIFGVCNATQKLCTLLMEKEIIPIAVLDNNLAKQGTYCQGIPVISPQDLINSGRKCEKIVFIVSRACEAMTAQLRDLGFQGRIEKLVEYNSFSEYSLSEETRKRKRERLERGLHYRQAVIDKYPGMFRLICPFNALGDVCFAMSYFPYFYRNRGINGGYVALAVGNSCADAAAMYGAAHIERLSQTEMDELVQAEIYLKSRDAYIAHHDRPYTSTVHKALKIKKFTLEEMYRYGVYGLDDSCKPIEPSCLTVYERIEDIPAARGVILSPYAKSSANIRESYWKELVQNYSAKGFTVYTNTVGEEKTLDGTVPLSVPLSAMRSVVERAGTFIGLRSGLCDVVGSADCRKIALYPDNYYSDTRWKTEEIFHMDGWENVVV